MGNPAADFAEAMQAVGITPPEHIVADGVLHRFSTNGAGGDDAGYYVLHADGIPAGVFGCWRSDTRQTWRAQPNGRAWSTEEQAEHRKRIAALRRQADAERKQRQEKAADKAAAFWAKATPAPADYAYLVRKGIQVHGTRIHRGALVVPVCDASGITSLQFIPADADESKVFLTGGAVAGGYFIIGEELIAEAPALAIAEGFATAATIHECTGLPVFVAFNAGNLLPVARVIRKAYPTARLVICADDDTAKEGNPGMTKATQAAVHVGAGLAIPQFGPGRGARDTDFNDMARLSGADAVRAAVLRAADLPAPGADLEPHGALASLQTIPGIDDRPCYVCLDEWTEHDGRNFKPGVWYCGIKDGEDGAKLHEAHVCSPLYIDAQTVDADGHNFGRLLRFKTTAGKWRTWAMPMEQLRGRGEELRGELLAMGVLIDPKAKQLLEMYLQSHLPTRFVRCALQVGWSDDSFVLPDTVIGPAASGVILQTGERHNHEYGKTSTLDAWRTEVSAYAIGNPLMLVALSAAFAGPLLARCHADSGGLHFVGDSSTGKTTLLEASCSVWGSPRFKRSWRATANGMEGAASLFNDCLLALDELSECDPREVGPIVYALGNGVGKQRASRTGMARGVTRWRCSVLSSGERTISTHMAEGGHRTKAGQGVRLLDIPASRTFGAFDELHGFATGAALADGLKRAAGAHYGQAGRAFLERLTRDDRDACALLEQIKALPAFTADASEGQDKRAAARFALLALAGELATEYGVTGWPEGDAMKAAASAFRAWQSLRGRGNDERRQIPEQIVEFIERHGDSRFSDADVAECAEAIRHNRAGWWRDGEEGRTYLFTTAGLREALHGFDFKRALDVLQSAGMLPASQANGERARSLRIGGRAARIYPIVLAGEQLL